MSLLTKHEVPFFFLSKSAFGFVFSQKRLERLTLMPLIVLFAACFIGMASVRTVETAEGPSQVLNLFYLFLFFAVVFVVCLVTMVRAHLTFADETGTSVQNKRLVAKKSLLYFLTFCQTSLFGLLITVFWAAVFYAVFFYFLKVGDFSRQFFALTTVTISPYFIIRFCCKFPAVTAGDGLSAYGAWKLTRGMSSALAIYYVMNAALPFMAVCLAASFLPVLTYTGISAAVINFLSLFFVAAGLLLSAICQAAFMNVVYDYLKKTRLEKNVEGNAIFSVAKNKNPD